MKLTSRAAILLFFVVFLSIFLISCNTTEKETIVLDKLNYKLVGDKEYKPLPLEDIKNLEKYVPNQEGFLLIQAFFTIPRELRNKDLALYIENVHVAAKFYLNGKLIGTNGRFPPDEFYGGKGASSYSLPSEVLNSDSENEIGILILAEGTCKLYSPPLIGEKDELELKARKSKFFMSDINLLFTVALILIALLYIMLYMYWREEKEYLWYGLLNLFTIFYLFAHFQGSVPWIIKNLNWLLFNKLFLGIAAFLAAYFATSFIRSFLGKKDTRVVTIVRLAFLLLAIIWVLTFVI